MGNDLMTDKSLDHLIGKIERDSESGEGIKLSDVYALANDCREMRRRVRAMADDLGPATPRWMACMTMTVGATRSRPLTVHVSPDLHAQLETCATLGKGTAARLVLERFAKRLATNGNDFWSAFAEMSGALRIAEDEACPSKEGGA